MKEETAPASKTTTTGKQDCNENTNTNNTISNYKYDEPDVVFSLIPDSTEDKNAHDEENIENATSYGIKYLRLKKSKMRQLIVGSLMKQNRRDLYFIFRYVKSRYQEYIQTPLNYRYFKDCVSELLEERILIKEGQHYYKLGLVSKFFSKK